MSSWRVLIIGKVYYVFNMYVAMTTFHTHLHHFPNICLKIDVIKTHFQCKTIVYMQVKFPMQKNCIHVSENNQLFVIRKKNPTLIYTESKPQLNQSPEAYPVATFK